MKYGQLIKYMKKQWSSSPLKGVLIEFKNSVQNYPQILSEVWKLDTWCINDCSTVLFEYFVCQGFLFDFFIEQVLFCLLPINHICHQSFFFFYFIDSAVLWGCEPAWKLLLIRMYDPTGNCLRHSVAWQRLPTFVLVSWHQGHLDSCRKVGLHMLVKKNCVKKGKEEKDL